jgi:formylglycine-generating enzyme required for sulfatase activity
VVTGVKAGKATAEVAHEILLKTWPTLKRWLEDEREFLVWRGELDARREEYDRAGKAGARQQRQALLMGLPLDTAKKWLETRSPDIEPSAQAFIEASVRADRVVTRNRQRLRGAVGILMLGTIVSLLGIIFKDEIRKFGFEQTTLRGYKAANFQGYVLQPEAERRLNFGEPFRECAKDCPEMVVIPPGEFWMGSPDGEGDDNEHPRHKVKIDKPLAVGKFEVTWDEWEACVKMRGCDGNQTDDGGFGRGRRPLIYVSWLQATDYVKWLTLMTGRPYRLLSEAEWEYAARGVTSADKSHQPYPWGDEASHEYANYGTDQCCNGRTEGRDTWFYTAPAGKFPPNAFGLHDMHGNVWEWVEDIWHDNYRGAPVDGRAWTEGEGKAASRRVVRGGSWDNNPRDLRSATRSKDATSSRGDVQGFRVGRELSARAGAVAPGDPIGVQGRP